MRAERPILFAGPTLAASERAAEIARAFRVRPPVRRFDIDRILEGAKRPTTIVVCDGVFHDSLAVGHAELRRALEAGIRVWGLSSMGAIRAREMMALGMRGYGRVFQHFVDEEDFQDDEVALLHEGTPPYRAVSDPLVHVRAAIAHFVREGIVREDAGADVIRTMKGRWYGQRTLKEAVALLMPMAIAPDRLQRGRWDPRAFALKTLDLERFAEERVWETDAPASAGKRGKASERTTRRGSTREQHHLKRT